MAENMEKRRHERIELHGHIADVADGNFIYGGIIEDVSISGLKLNSLPTKFAIEGRTYCIVVSGETSEAHFKIKVRPRWKRMVKSGLSMDVGFMVVEAPLEWTHLVKKMMPKKKKDEADVWDLRS
ncbi:MAG: PilZ domain-containing protein [Deltaproteobacteria bacterium]|nr:PilZ domain-containing protein [Deltaproteobacteria bacterium]